MIICKNIVDRGETHNYHDISWEWVRLHCHNVLKVYANIKSQVVLGHQRSSYPHE